MVSVYILGTEEWKGHMMNGEVMVIRKKSVQKNKSRALRKLLSGAVLWISAAVIGVLAIAVGILGLIMIGVSQLAEAILRKLKGRGGGI